MLVRWLGDPHVRIQDLTTIPRDKEPVMIPFIRNLVGVKTDRAVQASVEALVRWDPQAATEAELRTMEQHLDDLGLQVAQARASYEREKKEADSISALSRQRLAAAEQIEKQAGRRNRPHPQDGFREKPWHAGHHARGDGAGDRAGGG